MGRASPIVLAVQKARQRSGGQNAIGIDEHRRRTLYVAMTRAKDNLHLIVPQRFFTHGQSAQGDRHVYASRFIPNELLGFFDRTAWPAVATGLATARPASQGVRVDVGAHMRGM